MKDLDDEVDEVRAALLAAIKESANDTFNTKNTKAEISGMATAYSVLTMQQQQMAFDRRKKTSK